MDRITQRVYSAAILVITFCGLSLAQAPLTISHQGVLADTSGQPVSDGMRSITFKIYDSEFGMSELWTETQSVATVGGLFNVILGSITPISGIAFNRQMWLGVTVASNEEITPRTPLTSAPSAFTVSRPYLDTLIIQTVDLGTDLSERRNEDFSIYSGDAQIGLYSDPGGAVGSGIQFGGDIADLRIPEQVEHVSDNFQPVWSGQSSILVWDGPCV